MMTRKTLDPVVEELEPVVHAIGRHLVDLDRADLVQALDAARLLRRAFEEVPDRAVGQGEVGVLLVEVCPRRGELPRS